MLCCRYPVQPEMGAGHVCDEEEGEEGEGEEEGEEGVGEGEGEEWETEVTLHDQQLPMLVLPLYSLLSAERQAEVSAPPLHCQYTVCLCVYVCVRTGVQACSSWCATVCGSHEHC